MVGLAKDEVYQSNFKQHTQYKNKQKIAKFQTLLRRASKSLKIPIYANSPYKILNHAFPAISIVKRCTVV